MPTSEQIVTEFSDNLILRWLAAISVAFVLSLVVQFGLKFFSRRFSSLVKRTSNQWDDFFFLQLGKINYWFLFFWSLSVSLSVFLLEGPEAKIIRGVAVALSCWQIGRIGFAAIRQWHETVILVRVKQDASSAAALELFYSSIKGLFVVALVLIALSNLGVDVGAFLTGLGIGGIAVALAAQNILGDLLGSLSIALDKPFVVGDYIVVGADEGTVEHIGIKTTRVRSISGEELIFSNKDLLESRLRNFKRMWRRRVSHRFSLPFDTEIEKVNMIPKWIKEIAATLPKMRFDRCHLSSFENSYLNFDLVFWIEDTEYQVYMDQQQRLLVQLTEKMRSEGIVLAVPMRYIQVDTPVPAVNDQLGAKYPDAKYQLKGEMNL